MAICWMPSTRNAAMARAYHRLDLGTGGIGFDRGRRASGTPVSCKSVHSRPSSVSSMRINTDSRDSKSGLVFAHGSLFLDEGWVDADDKAGLESGPRDSLSTSLRFPVCLLDGFRETFQVENQ